MDYESIYLEVKQMDEQGIRSVTIDNDGVMTYHGNSPQESDTVDIAPSLAIVTGKQIGRAHV